MHVGGRYVAMHRSTFWRFKRVGQVNMFLHHGQREKQLIPTHKRHLKMVRIISLFCLYCRPYLFLSPSPSPHLSFQCVCMHVCMVLGWGCLQVLPILDWAFFVCIFLAAPVVTQVPGSFQSSSASLEPGYAYRSDALSVPGNPVTGGTVTTWSFNSVPAVNVSQVTKGIIYSCSLSGLALFFFLFFILPAKVML